VPGDWNRMSLFHFLVKLASQAEVRLIDEMSI
jgi:hypothetical protein